jgi:hypothetical protein
MNLFDKFEQRLNDSIDAVVLLSRTRSSLSQSERDALEALLVEIRHDMYCQAKDISIST